MKAVIIEDEMDLAEIISFNLEKEGWRTFIAPDGKSGFDLVTKELPDIVILDLMLPEMSGIEVCKTLKRKDITASIPIIMVTAKGEEIDRVVGFEVGADDYLVKPFSTRELLLRINAILRRSKLQGASEVISAGPIFIDTVRHLVKVDEEEIQLTFTEFKLLLTLVSRCGRVQSREQLLTEIWGYNSSADTRTVDTHLTRLRNKLGSAKDMIQTVRGYGYKLELP
ncbi:MAG: response regulator transcription factor [Desulfuromonadales bacterium]|nr:response regulator transcription factor [Desulfuromonadales bacterium]